MLATLDKLASGNTEKKKNNIADPRWAALKKLK